MKGFLMADLSIMERSLLIWTQDDMETPCNSIQIFKKEDYKQTNESRKLKI